MGTLVTQQLRQLDNQNFWLNCFAPSKESSRTTFNWTNWETSISSSIILPLFVQKRTNIVAWITITNVKNQHFWIQSTKKVNNNELSRHVFNNFIDFAIFNDINHHNCYWNDVFGFQQDFYCFKCNSDHFQWDFCCDCYWNVSF